MSASVAVVATERVLLMLMFPPLLEASTFAATTFTGPMSPAAVKLTVPLEAAVRASSGRLEAGGDEIDSSTAARRNDAAGFDNDVARTDGFIGQGRDGPHAATDDQVGAGVAESDRFSFRNAGSASRSGFVRRSGQ